MFVPCLLPAMLVLLPVVALAGPALSTGVTGLQLSFDTCRARVARALEIEGLGELRDFGNGWLGTSSRHSVSMACTHGVNETVLVVTVTGDNPLPLRDRLIALVRGASPSDGPSQPMPAAVFIHAPAGDWGRSHRDGILNYMSWDNARWTVRLRGQRFTHAPGGDWARAHDDNIINYISWDGARWTARVEGKTFLHAPAGDWARAHTDVIINYISWDGNRWTAKLE